MAPKIPEVCERKAHLVPRLQDGAWTDVQYARLRAPTSTSDQLRQINVVVDVDEIDWERAVTVPIARPPPRTTQVHRLSFSAGAVKISRTVLFEWLPLAREERCAGMESLASIRSCLVYLSRQTTCTHDCSELTMTTLAFSCGPALKQVVPDVQ
jgi:hypothetical protein